MPKQTASELVQTYWPVVVSVAAAIWATIAFVMKEAPLLALRVDGSGNLTWADTSSPVCRANFAVSFGNTGTTGFAVSKVRVRAWLIDASFSKGDKPTYFDAWGILGKTQPISDIVYASDTRNGGTVPLPLVAQYYAGMQYNHTFEWDVPRTDQRRFFVIAELFPPDSNAQTDWYFTAWSPVCGPPPPRESANSSERPYESFRNGAKQ